MLASTFDPRGRGRLQGSCAIVTGGASGIGKAAARLFASEGATVSIFDIQDDVSNGFLNEMRAFGGRAFYFNTNVGDATAVSESVAKSIEAMGKVDVLFNHAGTVIVKPFLETTEADWQRLMQINLMGMVHMSRAVLPAMLAAGKGCIVNTASISGLTASALESAYCVTKGACIQLTRAIAVEFRDRGIRCNALCPGFVRTPHGIREIQELSAMGASSEADIRIMQGRICEPEEVANAALFLASEDSSFINGEILIVDNAAMART